MTLVPLPVHPSPVTPADRARIYAALDHLRPPFPVSIVPAVPGSPGRVLGLRGWPPFLCDTAANVDPEDTDKLREAVKWVLDTREPLERGFTVGNYLSAIFGVEVRELVTKDRGDDGEDHRVQFRAE